MAMSHGCLTPTYRSLTPTSPMSHIAQTRSSPLFFIQIQLVVVDCTACFAILADGTLRALCTSTMNLCDGEVVCSDVSEND